MWRVCLESCLFSFIDSLVHWHNWKDVKYCFHFFIFSYSAGQLRCETQCRLEVLQQTCRLVIKNKTKEKSPKFNKHHHYLQVKVVNFTINSLLAHSFCSIVNIKLWSSRCHWILTKRCLVWKVLLDQYGIQWRKCKQNRTKLSWINQFHNYYDRTV